MHLLVFFLLQFTSSVFAPPIFGRRAEDQDLLQKTTALHKTPSEKHKLGFCKTCVFFLRHK
jgi:hypothetical protein